MPIYRELAEALSQTILGEPYNPKSTLPEHFKVQHLVEVAKEWSAGDIETPELVREFEGSGFDVRQWIMEMVEEGHFTLGPDDAP